MRRPTPGSLQHPSRVKGKKLFISSRPPRKCVDAIKSENVVDAKEMKHAPHSAHALPPPIEIVRLHCLPSVKRNAPVLPPFLGKLVVFEISLRRRAAAPVEDKFIRSG